MNIKLHTPTSLKSGSGMGSMKQFLLSLLATTVSIALTFGTAAVIDYKKKKSEKREIVMMVMYDMHRSLQQAEEADSSIRQMMRLQLQLAKDTTSLNRFRAESRMLLPLINFAGTTTTERIFSTSIETINTVGNVMFNEVVEDFYTARRYYKAEVCDSIISRVSVEQPFSTLKGALDLDLEEYAILSDGFLLSFRSYFSSCKQLMKVSDKELEAYRKGRRQMDPGTPENDESSLKELKQLHDEIEAQKAQLEQGRQ